MLKEIRYFYKYDHLRGGIRLKSTNLDEEIKTAWINIQYVVSLSGVLVWVSLAEEIIGSYHELVMANGDIYYLKPGDHMDVLYHSDNVMD